MKVKDIQIDGFGVWTGLSVDSLSESMTLFYGPNEAGKTTLMQFVRAMLYGFTEQRREKYLPPLHGGTPGGALRVTGPGGGYQIRRHSQLTDQGVTGQLSVTGQDGLTQGQHRLSSLLGQIDEPIFTNVFAIGLRELQELSTLDDTDAADELYKLSSGLDRVSLVDVMRVLRDGRGSLVGSSTSEENAQAEKLVGLIRRRESLRDEVEQLTRGGRRWSELASQRRTQQQEIDQLSERIDSWEQESRCVEVATTVFETWGKRAAVAEQIRQLESGNQLPDEAPGQLVQIEAMMDDRRQKLEEVKNKRRLIREKADQLPVSRRMLDLQGRIEAAAEQATWVEALEEQIERVDIQIEKAKKQLSIDAERVGIDELDRDALVEGDTSALPDLSRQTLSALAAPAKLVKEHSFLLKQSRSEAAEHKERADKLDEQLQEVLDKAHAHDLQQAIRAQNEMLASLRHRMQLGEHLSKLKRHYRDLEKETVELTTAEVLPVDRLVLLAVPFIFGGMSLIYGLANVLGFTWLVADPDPTWGILCVLVGVLSMFTYYFGRENGQRATSSEREDCERQIDTLRRQIRELEAERNDVDSTLPTSNDALETRAGETERLIAELEAALPVYHSHQAALHAYQTARDRAVNAAEELKKARRQWTTTLNELGLSETMSPSSVRSLSDGYETIQASRRRLEELQSEKEQRRRERQTIAKRIETLYLEAIEASRQDTSGPDTDHEESDKQHGNHDRETSRARNQEVTDARPPVNRSKPHSSPLQQLNHLHEELSRHQHWIKRRRELKEQDLHLKRQQSVHHRAIERGEQQRRALWAKCGVATAEQFYHIVDDQAKLKDLQRDHADLDKQVRSMVGTHVKYDDVEREINGANAADLEKRWESLTTRISETEARIARLRTQLGELAQEMKHLADDNRLSVAQLELGCVERRIEGICRRWQTLATASVLLEDVCGTFERERQPETLREASTFLNQLTDGRYTRIWTPLGTNQLKIDDADEASLPLHVLSRGTREAVFIALRLSLAAAYARRGVMLPLVLDDVLVNFDRERAMHAARTLQTFAELGHQVMMFTCHQHIVDIFHDIGVEVRQMPPQGEPGRAYILPPPEVSETTEVTETLDVDDATEATDEEIWEDEVDAEEPEVLEIESAEEEFDEELVEPVDETPEVEPEPEQEQEPEVEPEPVAHTEPEPEASVEPQEPKTEPVAAPLPATRLRKRPLATKRRPAAPQPETSRTGLDWAWFEREPAERLDEVQNAISSLQDEGAAEWPSEQNRSEEIEEVWDESSHMNDPVPDEVWDRSGSWWQ